MEILLHLAYSFCTMMSSGAGLAISGSLSSASRATIDATRIIIIWIASFALKWEVWHNVSTPVRLVGFACIVLGTLVYNDVVKIIPYLRMTNIMKYGKCLGKNKPKEARTVVLDEIASQFDKTPIVPGMRNSASS